MNPNQSETSNPNESERTSQSKWIRGQSDLNGILNPNQSEEFRPRIHEDWKIGPDSFGFKVSDWLGLRRIDF